MVHMFLTGEPNRSKEFSQYLRLAVGGTPAVDAWRQAFGSLDAIQELKRFLRNPIVRGFRYTFDERIGTLAAQVTMPKPSDVDGALAALLRYAAPEEMETRLRRAVEMTPPSMLARSLLGVAIVRKNLHADATPLLFEAAADTSDWLVQYHVANGLTQIARAFGRQRDEKVVTAARAAGAVRRFSASAFSDVDFVSYRDEQAGSINCGDRKPADPVYVTWVAITPAPPGIAGRPVAVEFLPRK